MKCSSFVFLVFGMLGSGFQSGRAANSEIAQDYAQIAEQRAHKIAALLAVEDSAKAARVQAIIARQYRDLNGIQVSRDNEIGSTNVRSDSAASKVKITLSRESAEAQIKALHPDYLARLAVELTPAQIDQVKDGMTYGVLPLTWRVYQQMLPDLTPEQKQQILAWLTEAREHAMDGGSSEEKHAWFGKYKGKINNYLSAAGIDMKAAEKNLARRNAAVAR